jgi:hypothetical protein
LYLCHCIRPKNFLWPCTMHRDLSFNILLTSLSLQLAGVVEARIMVVPIARVEVFFSFLCTHWLHGVSLSSNIPSIQHDFLCCSRVWAWPIFDSSWCCHNKLWLSFWRSRLPSAEAEQRGWPTTTRIFKENLRSWIQEELWSWLTAGNL